MEGIEAQGGDDHGDLGAEAISRFKNSAAPEHQQLRAVVSAIMQVLRDQGLPLTPTTYFGASMSPLEQQCSIDAVGGADTTAFCTFLSMVLPKLSKAVLKSQSNKTLEVLVKLLNSSKVNHNTIKVALTCLQYVVAAADKSHWIPLLPAFNVVLRFTMDIRPKVRKRAHVCIAEFLASFQNTPCLEKASEAFATNFEQCIFSVGIAATSKKAKQKEATNPVQVLHMLGASRHVLLAMSQKGIAKILPSLMKLLEMRQPIVTRQVLDVLLVFFMRSRSDIPIPEAGNLLGTVSSLISAGNRNVNEVTTAVRVVQYGIINLNAVDSSTSVSVLPAPFHAITELFASEQEEVAFAAAESLRSLVRTCINDTMINQGIAKFESNANYVTSIERIAASAESTLSYQYSGNWDKALQVISSLFERLGSAASGPMAGIIRALAELQKLSDEDMPFRKQLHGALGTAVTAMGPEQFLKILPLEMDKPDLTVARVWLIPILKQNIVGAQLAYYASNILPFAVKLGERAQKYTGEGKTGTAMAASSHSLALWALLPAFCNFPVDTRKSFQLLAKSLGEALKNNAKVRGLIFTSLQVLIRQNRFAKGDLEEDEETERQLKGRTLYSRETASANLLAIAAFSENFLPLLFNIFCSSPPEKRGDLQATIGALASISTKKTVQKFFKSIVEKLLDAMKSAEDANDRRRMFMDLSLSLIGGLDDKGLSTLLAVAQPALQDKDSGVQKKGYKILASICKEHTYFVGVKSNEILQAVHSGMTTCQSSAKQYRMSCLQALALHLVKAGDANSAVLLLKEAILGLKEINKKTRNAAYDFIIGIGQGLRDVDERHLVQYFTMVVGCTAVTGTASEPHAISAALSAMSRLVYEFSSDLESEVEKYLPSAYYLLRNFKNREVIKSLLGLMKVVVARLPTEKLSLELKEMVPAMMVWSDDSKNRFKAKVRIILEKMIRRCGFNAVSAVVPPQHSRHLTNIRKVKERAEKKKASIAGDFEQRSVHSAGTSTRLSKWSQSDFFSDMEDEGDTDDGDDMRTRSLTTVRSRKVAKSKRRLPEDMVEAGSSEPLNLLDMPMTRAALSAPKRKQTTDSDDEQMRFDPEGRLIIEEDRQKKRQRDDDEDEDDDFKKSKASRKRGGPGSKAGSTVAGTMKSNLKNKRLKKSESSWVYKGDEYSNKKSGGDVKRDGKLEPYAYWPLDPKMLNRRENKKSAARKGMQSVFKMTKKMEGLSVNKALKVSSSRGIQKKHKGSSSSNRSRRK